MTTRLCPAYPSFRVGERQAQFDHARAHHVIKGRRRHNAAMAPLSFNPLRSGKVDRSLRLVHVPTIVCLPDKKQRRPTRHPDHLPNQGEGGATWQI